MDGDADDIRIVIQELLVALTTLPFSKWHNSLWRKKLLREFFEFDTEDFDLFCSIRLMFLELEVVFEMPAVCMATPRDSGESQEFPNT